jgi:lysophospholipase L1-like esterase
MALARGAVFVDVYAAWGNRSGLMGADGIHPTEAGYEVIAQTFFDAIRKALEPPLP